jgi:hypothetical protein
MVGWEVLFPILGIREATKANVFGQLSISSVSECEVFIVPFQAVESNVGGSPFIIAHQVLLGEFRCKVFLEEVKNLQDD